MRAMSTCRVLVLAGLVWAGPVLAGQEPSSSDAPSAAFVLPSGSRQVRVLDVSIKDEARDKSLELRVRVPVGDAPEGGWPLIVFSHGAGGSKTAFGELLDHLASHGFASIAPTHADSIALRRREGEDVGRLGTAAGRERLRRDVRLGDRVADCVLVLDQMANIAEEVRKSGGPELVINKERVAIGGHSAGAFTTQLASGVKARAAGIGKRGLGFTSIADPRFKAAIVISGQGTTSRILGEESWSDVAVPMLVMAGSLDTSPPEMGRETPESRQEPFTRARGEQRGGPPAYLLFIDGATHGSYQGKSVGRLLGEQPTTEPAQIQRAVATSSLLFLRAHLLGDADAKEQLRQPRMDDMIPGKVRFEHK